MHPSTKVCATLFAGALAVTCGIALATTGSDWYRPLSNVEEKNSGSRHEESRSGSHTRGKSTSHDCAEGVDNEAHLCDYSFEDRHGYAPGVDHENLENQGQSPAPLKRGNITVWTPTANGPATSEQTSSGLAVAITPPASPTDASPQNEGSPLQRKRSCSGFLELCSMFEAPRVEKKSITARTTPPQRILEAPPKLLDPMPVAVGDPGFQPEEISRRESVQEPSSGSVEHVVWVQDGSSSSLSSPPAENRALNPLAVPFQPVRKLDPNANPFQPGRRRLNPNATPFDPSQGFS